MKIGDRFKGKVNNELFEIIAEYIKDNKVYFWVNHLKSGKVYELEKQYLEHLLIEVII